MKRRLPETSLSGVNLLEEAVHTLRRASVGTLFCYYFGTVPFVLALLFFWSDMSQSGGAEERLVPGAILLSVLFFWMKAWQSAFALRISAQVANEPVPSIKPGAWFRAIGSQTFLQATGFILLFAAALVVVPLGWVYAFYQNATVLGLREPGLGGLIRRSWRQSLSDPMQNHAALLIFALFGLFVFLNVCVCILAVPFLAKMLLGVETQFTLSLLSSLNTTFLAVAVGITYLCLDPLIKATYALRCFYGESRTTGEDLRVALRYLTKPAQLALTVLILLAMPLGTTTTRAAQAPTEQSQELDRSINEVLERREFTWRSPRPKAERKAREQSELSKRISEWMKSTVKGTLEWIGRQLSKLFRPRGGGGGSGFSFTTEGLVYLLIALVVVIVGILLWVLWRSRSNRAAIATEATTAAPLPDLESDDVTGAELPVDGWMQLALELLGRGELRLAMRAFYLSSLAHLASRNLVNIAKFKSNRDYERELRRRSHALPEVSRTFSENVSVFDRVWYGMHDIDGDLLQRFRTNVERIKES